MIIYFDIDGVLADFNGYVFDKTGRNFSSELWSELLKNHSRMYRELTPIQHSIHFLQSLVLGGNDVRILSALPSTINFKYAKEDKLHWCNTHLNGIPVTIVDKAIMKQQCCSNGDILIDDNHLNVEQWKSSGGVGVLYQQPSKCL